MLESTIAIIHAELPVLLTHRLKSEYAIFNTLEEAQAASGKIDNPLVRTRSVHGCELRICKLVKTAQIRHFRFDIFFQEQMLRQRSLVGSGTPRFHEALSTEHAADRRELYGDQEETKSSINIKYYTGSTKKKKRKKKMLNLSPCDSAWCVQ